MQNKDIFGKALIDYYEHHGRQETSQFVENIQTWTNISEVDELPLSFLFRSYEKMPGIEQKALALCTGKILDVGCGAGSHCLYLQNTGKNVKGIDISKGAVHVSKRRGVHKVEQRHILEINEKFDTIILMMNGTGIFQKFDKIKTYLKHLKSLLSPKGQILIDSSDIKYMYDDYEINAYNFDYYGELDYYISYKGEKEMPMTWLYLDFDSLKEQCCDLALHCEKIMEGDHFDYLAKITDQNN